MAVKFEIVEEIATLSENGNWTKQLNLVIWGENPAKYDIRPWSSEHTQPGKGVTLSLQELIELKKALMAMDI